MPKQLNIVNFERKNQTKRRCKVRGIRVDNFFKLEFTSTSTQLQYLETPLKK